MSNRKAVMFVAIVALIMSLVSGPLAASAQAPGTPATPETALERMEKFWLDQYGRPDDPPGINPSIVAQATLPMPMGGRLLAKAQPDECFDGIGHPYPPGPPCATGQPKVNQAYVWGLTKAGNHLWFGTAANVLCPVIGGGLGYTIPFQTNPWVCEFGSTSYPSPLPIPLPAALGDWRPPRIYLYSTATDTLLEKSPADVLFGRTVGIRFAANLNNVVLLGGPTFGTGINLFAFQADTGDYLGSVNLPAYNDIRKSVVVNNVLYVGVGVQGGAGAVLRWYGDVANPFYFEKVGDVGGDAAELAQHNGRIFVSTWPRVGQNASLYMSPLIPADGLTTADAPNWTQVWQATDYEPDPLVAATYGGGALMSYGGWLYWGTMHVPLYSAVAFFNTYGVPSDPLEILTAILGTYRPITIFRGRDFDTTAEVQLLYGSPLLPVYDPGTGWQFVSNNMGKWPYYGLSGFWNFFNNYTWSMEIYQGQLFVGTMDWSFLFAALVKSYLSQLGVQNATEMVEQLQSPVPFLGADLWRFPNSSWPAIPVSISGVGNFTNYGIRNMVAGSGLYLGMANPMNLFTDPNDRKPAGGWELIGLNQMPGPMLYGYVFIDENGDGVRQETEQTGLNEVWITLEKAGYSGDATKTVGDDGWYQFDLIMSGQYTLKANIPSDYAPTSPTEVTFTKVPPVDQYISFGVQKKWAQIGDRVWYDANANGVMDGDEPGISNVTVDLLADNAGAPGEWVATATTANDGAYLFDGILPGVYWAKVTDTNNALAQMTLTAGPNSQPNPHGPITVANKQAYLDADFGYAFIPGPAQTVISDLVWNDLNGNGVQDPGEPGIPGIQVCAQTVSYIGRVCATTNSNGIYGIFGLSPRAYLISVTIPPAGMSLTHGFYVPVVLRPGERRTDIDFGYR